MPAGFTPLIQARISRSPDQGRFVAPFNLKRPADESAKDLRRFL
jgi:hypothetical protein